MDKEARESARAFQALRDYAYMGPARSLRKLHAAYEAQAAAWEEDPSKGGYPPTVRLTTLNSWSVTHRWQARVEAWEKERDEEAERAVRAARLSLALAAQQAASSLVAILQSDDEAQKRLAAGDILDRVGVAKGVHVELDLPPIRYIEVGGDEDTEGAS